jgi:small subunit ribosomal protein S17
MAEEEKQDTEETTEESAEEQAAEAEAPQEEAPEVEAAEGAPEAEVAEDEAPEADAAEEAAEAPAEPEEVLSPKQRRKRARSQASAPAGPQRTPQERAAERAERRRIAAINRRRYRASQRAMRGEKRGQGTPRPDREPGSKKVRQGTVVSAGADKTITVEIPVVRRHPTYEKVVRRSSKLHAHDESNQAQEGDVVRVIESRPLSRTKRWRLLDVVEKSR